MRRLSWIAVFVVAAGCGGDAPPKLVAVTGKAVFDGKPLVGGSLTFHPESGAIEKGDRPSCQLQADGGFTVQTFPYGDGAVPGKYKVTLSSDLAGRIRRPQCADPAMTPLRIDIPDAGVSGHTLEVK